MAHACRLTFFDKIKYVIGGQEYSANDIEHGILRGNKASPTNPWVLVGLPSLSSGYFKSDDARAALVSSPILLSVAVAVLSAVRSIPWQIYGLLLLWLELTPCQKVTCTHKMMCIHM